MCNPIANEYLMKKKNFLTTGEFAKLCKTTKETLFHYDRENLLKPKYVSENGYRHYGVEQYLNFDLIAMLKETGSTLKEIKAYLYNMEAEGFLSLLEDKRLVVKKEIKRLMQRETMLQDMIACTRDALNFTYDSFAVQQQEEERLDIFPSTGDFSESRPEFVERLAEYIDFCESQKRTMRYPFGVVLNQDDMLRGQYRERYFFSRATHKTPKLQRHVKPAGSYAVLAHSGTTQTHLQTFDALLRQIQSAGLSITGNAYVYDMMSDVLLGVEERYAVKYCVRVG